MREDENQHYEIPEIGVFVIGPGFQAARRAIKTPSLRRGLKSQARLGGGKSL